MESTIHRSTNRAVRRHRSSRKTILALVMSLGLIAGACAAEPSSGSGSGSSTKEFCDFYEKAADKPPAGSEDPEPGVDTALLVKENVVTQAEDTNVFGGDCTAPNAKVELEGAMLAEGEERPAEDPDTGQGPGEAAGEVVAAVTGEDIQAEKAVLENVQLKSLTVEITAQGIKIRGNVAIRMSGQTSTVGFTGTLADLNNWSVAVSSSSFKIPGITTGPGLIFSGMLKVKNGKATLTLSANATQVKVGDVTITSAELDLVASQTEGVTAHVAGSVKVGPSSANGVVDVVFDRSGALVSANVNVDAHLVGTQTDGKLIDLQGAVSIDGTAKKMTASFSGSGVVGDLVVNEANGEIILETNKATFTGVLDVQQGANVVRFRGSIVWDGITAYVPYMNLEGAGEISGTLDNGQTFAVSGSIEAEMIGGQLVSVVTGNFQIGTLKASGNAQLTVNGHTTTLDLNANLTDAGFDATLQGAVQITDGRAELIQLDAAINGQMQLGDATLTGANMSIRSSYGSPLDIKFAGGIKVGNKADVTGSLAALIGPDGKLLSLQGDIYGSLSLDSWALINFSGSVMATVDQVTISGQGGIHLSSFPLGLTIKGSLTSSLHTETWSLNGQAKVKIASIELASARLKLSHTDGMAATNAGFYFRIIGIPTYLEGDFYLTPSGGCDHVKLTGGSFLARPIARATLPGVLNCSVS